MTGSLEADEKRCPKCSETVKMEALRCKHCGYKLGGFRWWYVPLTVLALFIAFVIFGAMQPEQPKSVCDRMSKTQLYDAGYSYEECRRMFRSADDQAGVRRND